MRLCLLALLITAWGIIFGFAPHATARPSAGCGQEGVSPPELIDVDGRLRHAIVVLPDDYEPTRQHPVLFGFHGRTNDNAKARRYFDLESSSISPTIFVYPAGLKEENGGFTWWNIGEPAEALRDFAFFETLLARLASGFCIDLDAVHVIGHSLGASFANSLACARGNRIRSVISVAGGINPTTCVGDVAAMIIHNPRDEAVPISEGERARNLLLGPVRVDEQPLQQEIGPFTCTRYRTGQNPLFWCMHHQNLTRHGRYYPHRWPDDMSGAVAAFFKELDR